MKKLCELSLIQENYLTRRRKEDRQWTCNLTSWRVLCNVGTSTALLTAWYHLTRRQRSYGFSMSPAAINHTNMPSSEVRDTGPSVTKFGISRQIFVKVHNIKFQRNPSSGGSADIYMDGRTDRQTDRQQTDGNDEGNGRFTRPCELRLKTKQEFPGHLPSPVISLSFL